MYAQETIVAVATAPGQGGVGIVRVSGPLSQTIARVLCGACPVPRHAQFTPFKNQAGELLDEGIALFFPGPNSFTGEDVLELQGHGGPIVLDRVVQAALAAGARPARPGEFSERAFLNNKMDLAQAEAVADLIAAGSASAAQAALNSLSGVFSENINDLVEAITQLRMYVEAAIDFPEEEINFLEDTHILASLNRILEKIETLQRTTQQGILLRDGMSVVLVGLPNAGKSSLLNALSGVDRAIVTDIAGTTRDTLQETIQIDGLPLHIVDTAGLRETEDTVEQIGVQRTLEAIHNADAIVWVQDATDPTQQHELDTFSQDWPHIAEAIEKKTPIIIVRNKIDKLPHAHVSNPTHIMLSAKTRQGLDQFRAALKKTVGFAQPKEGAVIARRRHLDAVSVAHEYCITAKQHLTHDQAGELCAEALRLAQQSLATITGAFTPDDLLGRIFSEFCIGK